ncbi:MAG: outer membrane protein transport protein [Cyclobacteriaceae bacterium]
MKRVMIYFSAMLTTIWLLVPFGVNATNGYFSHGYGVRYKAMAGSGVSLSFSTLGAANNPAGLVHLGKRFDVGLAMFIPKREFTVVGNPSGFPGTFGLAPGTVQSERNGFFIPSIGSNFMFNDKSSIGVSVYGNGGMNTRYPSSVFGGANPTGVDLTQLFVQTTYSRKLGEKHSVGISSILAFQFFEATGLEAFANFSSDPSHLTAMGHDTSFGTGLKFGYMGEWTEGLRFGASYQMKLEMSQFDKYAGLFAGHGSFDIPANWTVGLSYQMSDRWLMSFDVQQILYGGISSIANPLDPMALPPAFPDGSGGFVPNPNQVGLGEAGASGFGWDDVMIYKFGTEFSGVEDWKFRAGFSLTEQPIPASEMIFNILAPGVIEKHATVGFSKAMGEKNELSFSLMHGFSNTISGPNMFEAPNQQTIELTMHQWEFEVGFTF